MRRWGAFAIAAIVIVPSLLATCGCDDSTSTPATTVVAWIDERPVALADWERYRAANLLELPGEPPADDRVLSRLFDAFLDERLLVAESLRRGLTASDLEIDAWLDFAEDAAAADPVAVERWEAARRRVLTQKLEEQVVRAMPDQAVDSALEERSEGAGDAPPVGRHVRLSSLRFETADVAERIARRIDEGKETFDGALIDHGSAQDGVPVDLAWQSLGEGHRSALEGLRAGQVGGPVAIGGAFYLFRVDAWLDADAAVAVRQARQQRGLERSRRQEAFAALLAELRENRTIRLNLAALPFGYVADPGDS